MVYKFKTLVIYIYILNDMCENLFLGIHTMSNQFLFKNQVWQLRTNGFWVLLRDSNELGDGMDPLSICLWEAAQAAQGSSIAHKNTHSQKNNFFSQYSQPCNPPIMNSSIELTKINKVDIHRH
jgi:hypothetical protein